MGSLFCEECGESLDKSQSTCSRCGRKQKKKYVLFVIILLSILGIAGIKYVNSNLLAMWGLGNKELKSSEYIRCQGNLKTMAVALERYALDNEGEYPPDLRALVPDYLYKIPVCPAAGYDTYSDGYKSFPPANGKKADFRICCGGNNHSSFCNENYPQYSGEEGLKTGP